FRKIYVGGPCKSLTKTQILTPTSQPLDFALQNLVGVALNFILAAQSPGHTMPSFAVLNFAMKRFVIRDKFGNHDTRILNFTTRNFMVQILRPTEQNF
ncbi:hypothetical protein, partial [uncultured Campylobacter sp.]|uniref:hypothetical protein n=1 Tax=uncultured Campylobacter sp. TaxID=218934 RepID=UPI00260DC2F9